MRIWFQWLVLIVPGMVLGMALSASAIADGPSAGEKPSVSGSIRLAQLNRVCCQIGHKKTLTTRFQCQQQRGRVVRDSACRVGHDDRQPVCCARRDKNWITSERECRRARGQIIKARYCHVCCQKDGRYRLRTHQECRRRRGRAVDLQYCRRHQDLVCCYKQTRDGKHHFRRLQLQACKDWTGRRVAEKYCRR